MVQMAEERPEEDVDEQERQRGTLEQEIRVQQCRNHIRLAHSVNTYLIICRKNVA